MAGQEIPPKRWDPKVKDFTTDDLGACPHGEEHLRCNNLGIENKGIILEKAEVNWVLKSCFDIWKIDNEKIKMAKKLLMAKCESQKTSVSLQRGPHSSSGKVEIAEKRQKMIFSATELQRCGNA